MVEEFLAPPRVRAVEPHTVFSAENTRAGWAVLLKMLPFFALISAGGLADAFRLLPETAAAPVSVFTLLISVAALPLAGKTAAAELYGRTLPFFPFAFFWRALAGSFACALPFGFAFAAVTGAFFPDLHPALKEAAGFLVCFAYTPAFGWALHRQLEKDGA
jgi:hypothetical protein